MSQAAADGTAVAYLNMADESRRPRAAAANPRRPLADRLELSLPGGRADVQRAIVLLSNNQSADAIEIDQMRRPEQAKIHQRHQALAAGQWPGLIAEPRHEIERFVEGCRIVIIEISRFH